MHSFMIVKLKLVDSIQEELYVLIVLSATYYVTLNKSAEIISK